VTDADQPEEILRAVNAANTEEVLSIARFWHELSDVTAEISVLLEDELGDLALDWAGRHGERYLARIRTIERSCRTISEGAALAHQALVEMASVTNERIDEVAQAARTAIDSPSGDPLAGVLRGGHGQEPSSETRRAAASEAAKKSTDLDAELDRIAAWIQVPGGDPYDPSARSAPMDGLPHAGTETERRVPWLLGDGQDN
jgi:hypothetical protein